MSDTTQEKSDEKKTTSEKYFDDAFYESISEELGRCARHHGGRRRIHDHGHWPGWLQYAAFEVPDPVNITPEEKLEKMKKREAWLQKELEELRAEIAEFTKEKA
jgi:hypothetical protein